MGEIFRMQLRQILTGRKRWLVLAFAALPVLLTWMTFNSAGGLEQLRSKIERDPRSPQWIQNVKGFGYKLVV